MKLLTKQVDYEDFLHKDGFLTLESIKAGKFQPYPPPREYPCYVYTSVRTHTPVFLTTKALREMLNGLGNKEQIMPNEGNNPIVPMSQEQLTSRTQFTVIADENANNFSLRIGNLMREGWKLHGHMAVVPRYYYGGNLIASTVYIQSLFRR